MARVTGFTAERMQAIEDTCIVSGAVLLDNLHLTQRDGTVIDAGNVRGPQGTAAAITGVSVVGLAAGAAPTVDAGGTPLARTFQFGIPKGDQGIQGIQGPSGTITSATASGLAAGAAPTIGLGGTPQARTLAFGIPKGDPGADGAAGSLATPAGTISLWGSDVAPANWMICDGSAISRTTYASLFAVIGTKYGAGDGVNTFNLPNLKGQTPIGKDTAQTEFAALNQKGGEKTHLLTTAEMPSHTHGFGTGITVPDLVAGATSYYWNATGPDRANAITATAATGGGAAHNVLQPYTVVNFIIKVTNGDTPGDSQLTQRVSNLETFASASPAGTITIFGGDTPPTNWMFCDGAAISRTTYASLFAAIGTKYGAGDGSTTFNLPNFKGKVPAGLDATQTEFNTLGKTGGEKTHLLTTAEMPSHTHPFQINGANNAVGVPTTAADASSSTPNRNTIGQGVVSGILVQLQGGAVGGGAAHNVLQPYLTVNYIIKITNGDTQGDSQLTQRVSAVEVKVNNDLSNETLRNRAYRLQNVLTGGGSRKVTSVGVSWTERFITMGAGMDSLAPSGYFDIQFPANGSVIPVYGGASGVTSVTVANSIIPLGTWQALYYDLPLGGTFPSLPGRFFIVDFQTTMSAPISEWAVLIAVRNPDPLSAYYTWGDGRSQDYWRTVTLGAGFTQYSGGSTVATDYAPASYRFADDGKVVLRGLVASTAANGSSFFQMPSTSLGPDQRAIFAVQANAGMARVDVTYDGFVVLMNYFASGSGGYITLEGIEWYPRGF